MGGRGGGAWADSDSGNRMWHHLPLDSGSAVSHVFLRCTGRSKGREERLYIMNGRGVS